jgi:hypothetical protein
MEVYLYVPTDEPLARIEDYRAPIFLPKGWLPLRDALHRIGRAMFGQDWTGDEVAEPPTRTLKDAEHRSLSEADREGLRQSHARRKRRDAATLLLRQPLRIGAIPSAFLCRFGNYFRQVNGKIWLGHEADDLTDYAGRIEAEQLVRVLVSEEALARLIALVQANGVRAHSAPANDPPSKKGRPGRKPKYLEDVSRFLLERAEHPDGFEGWSLAKAERHVLDRFAEMGGEIPAESTVRELIKKLRPNGWADN